MSGVVKNCDRPSEEEWSEKVIKVDDQNFGKLFSLKRVESVDVEGEEAG